MHLSLTRHPPYALMVATTGGIVRLDAETEATRAHAYYALVKAFEVEKTEQGREHPYPTI